MKKKTIKLTESELKSIIKRILREQYEDDFNAHGYKTTSNFCGNEIEISNSNDAARIKYSDGEITDWLEIEYDDEDEAYVETDYGREYLSDYIRYNSVWG